MRTPTLVKAIKARRYVGWYAYGRRDSRFPFARIENLHGLPILYKTKQAALDAAADSVRRWTRAETGR